MSQSHQALGARDNWWGESTVDDLRDKEVSELTTDECERLIEADTTWNVPTDAMSEREIREFVRGMRDESQSVQPCTSAYEIARWKAHQILRQVTTKHSKTAKRAPPDRGDAPLWAWLFRDEEETELIVDHDPTAMHHERCEVELTDPELHLGKLYEDGDFGLFEYGQYRYRKRYDDEHGYIGGVAFDDMEPEKFFEVVGIVLDNAKEEKSFRSERIDEWFDVAKRLKSKQDQSDQDVLTEILRRVYLSAE
ncbi:hypothetical protein G9464_20635 [Halostella sp. JP-L12]|uniref:hypothetical protein n=1 Tax=Halostella TaxID=1843185 RepID=UPI000EF83596|nr:MULTISPECIES: hypothetical protein [Halostella]NHN49979.1 hypothetical protein [Halostella sp. JP-L12]